MSLKTETAITNRLQQLERTMQEKADYAEKNGYGKVSCWDKNCVERETLRWALGLKRKPFNAADTMTGW